MASTPSSSPASSLENPRVAARLLEREKLRTSRFDSVTSLLLALIIFIGTFVTMLFIIWLTTRWVYSRHLSCLQSKSRQAEAKIQRVLKETLSPPGAEEVEELMEPTLQDTLEAVTDAVSTVAGALATTDTAATATTTGTARVIVDHPDHRAKVRTLCLDLNAGNLTFLPEMCGPTLLSSITSKLNWVRLVDPFKVSMLLRISHQEFRREESKIHHPRSVFTSCGIAQAH